jgi:hypothetical protein
MEEDPFLAFHKSLGILTFYLKPEEGTTGMGYSTTLVRHSGETSVFWLGAQSEEGVSTVFFPNLKRQAGGRKN